MAAVRNERTTTDPSGRRRLLTQITGGAAVAAGAVLAARSPRSPARAHPLPGIVGSWLMTVPQPNEPDFLAVQNYTADGGTTTQFASGDPTQGASLGAGVWTQTDERTFAMTFLAPTYAATGEVNGQATVQATWTLDESGDGLSGPSVITFRRLDGTVRFRTPPTVVTGRRVRHEPLD